MRTAWLRLVAPFAFVSAAALLPACGGSSASGGGAQASLDRARMDAASMETRLRGTWRLVDYRPEVPLEATFQMLLQEQMQTMQIRFDNGHLLADSPTIHLDRTFQVSEVAGNLFKLTTTDQDGVALTSSCEISADGSTIYFRGETPPWRGYGTLKRVG